MEEDSRDFKHAADIANAFRTFLPLFMRNGTSEGDTYGEEKTENIQRIIADLMGICWGDEPRFFAISKRQQGLHKRPYRLARLRLSALEWDKFLATAGMSAFEHHRIVSDAFRTDWQAIRKWGKSIDEQFDLRPYLRSSPEEIIKEYAENPDAVLATIRRDGDAYWLERSFNSSGKD